MHMSHSSPLQSVNLGVRLVYVKWPKCPHCIPGNARKCQCMTQNWHIPGIHGSIYQENTRSALMWHLLAILGLKRPPHAVQVPWRGIWITRDWCLSMYARHIPVRHQIDSNLGLNDFIPMIQVPWPSIMTDVSLCMPGVYQERSHWCQSPWHTTPRYHLNNNNSYLAQ